MTKQVTAVHTEDRVKPLRKHYLFIDLYLS